MSDAPKEGRITLEKRGHLLLMGVDRVPKRNAFGPEMLDALSAAYGQLESDADVRCGVLFAHGPHFTAGLDLAAVAPVMAERGGAFYPAGAYDPWGLFGKVRTKPMVMAVQGLCLTLGIELVLASDIAIAATDARFAQIEIKRGIFPFGGATFRMPVRIGWGNAMRWLLTGDELDAKEAHRIGLVQELVEPGQQLTRAIELAERIAKQAPLGVRATIESARHVLSGDYAKATAELIPKLQGLMASEDAGEGMASFIERREATFSGK
jgi:enoyl-CoA hydratase/carnithine racemase